MIYCLNCGKGIPDQSKFCTFCGTAIATADAKLPETNTPTVPEQSSNPIPPPPQFVSTPPPPQPQYIPSTPPQQQYTPPPQIPPQYSNPTPPPVQQYAAATSATVVGTAKNEFYKNAGFWGAVLALVGFFLPYTSLSDASFYYLVSDLAPEKPELYLYLIFPVSAAILIIQGLTGMLPKFIVAIFKILPLLMLILFAIGISQNSSQFGFMGNDVGTVMSSIGVGLYMTVIGTILMLFFRTTKTK